MIAIAHPLLGREEAVLNILASGQLSQGENVAALERRFAEVCRVQEAVAISSDTADINPVLLAHQIDVGENVSSATYCSSAISVVVISLSCTSPDFPDRERFG